MFVKIKKNILSLKSLYIGQILSIMTDNVFGMESNKSKNIDNIFNKNEKNIFDVFNKVNTNINVNNNNFLDENQNPNISLNLNLSSIEHNSNKNSSNFADENSSISLFEIKLIGKKRLNKNQINSIFDKYLNLLLNNGFKNIVEYINSYMIKSVNIIKEKYENNIIDKKNNLNITNIKFFSFDITHNISHEFLFKKKLIDVLCVNNENIKVVTILKEIFKESDLNKLLLEFSKLSIDENVNINNEYKKNDKILYLKNIFDKSFINIFLNTYIKGTDFRYNYIDDITNEDIKDEITENIHVFTEENIENFIKNKENEKNLKVKKHKNIRNKKNNKIKIKYDKKNCINLEEDE